jgi:hypothetical protein
VRRRSRRSHQLEQEEVGFKIGFNKRPSGRISLQNRARAERRINSIGHDVEFRNQQVAGSIPAGGSKTSLKTKDFPEPLDSENHFLPSNCAKTVPKPLQAGSPVPELPLSFVLRFSYARASRFICSFICEYFLNTFASPWRRNCVTHSSATPPALKPRQPGGRLRAGGGIAALCLVTLLFPIAPSVGHFLVVWSTAKGTFVMTPLRQRMMEDLQIRNYAPSTVKAYTRGVAEFAKHFGKSPDRLGAEQIREYQLFLIKEKKIALPTYIQIVSGLRFLYTNTPHRQIGIERMPFPRCERKLPIIMSREEVKALLEAPKNLGHHRFCPPCMLPVRGSRKQRTSRYLTSIAAEM